MTPREKHEDDVIFSKQRIDTQDRLTLHGLVLMTK
jgi:hypothetical protein